MNSDPTCALAAEVLAYLAQHPRAADTADGIRRFWLADCGAHALEEVEYVLDRLVRKGIMARRRLPDGGMLYVDAR
jgi:hypothetical protein